ncbi:mobilization protein [Bacteroidia bacterium]|nr:mobilization protein [Bacteroidia bacterium]
MMAKIVQGCGFRGVINYVLDKSKAQLLYAEGVRLKDKESIIHSFITQSYANNIAKPVAHISLNFSEQDKAKATNVFMVGMAQEYLKKMGYGNTQYIIVRHNDRDHPHIHIVINRIDNDGKRISDKNEKLRSTKICLELTKKCCLYISSGKENVKRERLRGTDKTKYEIYDAIKAAIPKCRNWKELSAKLQKFGITTEFQHNGSTDKIQGVRFGKDDFTFNGSKIDRKCSYSKIDYQLQQNNRAQETSIHSFHSEQFQNQPSTLEAAGSLLGGLFDFPTSDSDFDPEQAEWLRQHKKKKNKGHSL